MSRRSEDVIEYQIACERNIVGACLLEPSIVPLVVSFVSEDDFIDNTMKELIEIISMLDAAGERVTSHSVMLMANRTGLIERMGGAAEYARLSIDAPNPGTVEYFARELARLSYARKLQVAAIKLMEAVSTKECDPDKAALEFEAVSKKYSVAASKHGVVLDNVLNEIVEANSEEAPEEPNRRIPTGYPSLDSEIGGFYTKQIILLGGRFGKGKTAMAAEMAMAAINSNHSALVISIEMTRNEFVKRMISSAMGVSMFSWRRKLLKEDYDKVVEFKSNMKSVRLRIDDTSRQGMRSLRAAMQLAKARDNTDIVFIDNLQLIQAMDYRVQRDQQLVAITAELKRIAKELDVAIVLLAQLNADAEKGVPDNTSFAGAKGIVGDADTILLLHHVQEGTSDYSLLVTKNRQGTTASLPMEFVGSYQRFIDLKVRSLSNSVDEQEVPY